MQPDVLHYELTRLTFAIPGVREFQARYESAVPDLPGEDVARPEQPADRGVPILGIRDPPDRLYEQRDEPPADADRGGVEHGGLGAEQPAGRPCPIAASRARMPNGPDLHLADVRLPTCRSGDVPYPDRRAAWQSGSGDQLSAR